MKLEEDLSNAVKKYVSLRIDKIIECYIDAPLKKGKGGKVLNDEYRPKIVDYIVKNAIANNLETIRFDTLLNTHDPSKFFPTLPFIHRSTIKEDNATICAYSLWAVCQPDQVANNDTLFIKGYPEECTKDPKCKNELFEAVAKLAREAASSYADKALAYMQQAINNNKKSLEKQSNDKPHRYATDVKVEITIDKVEKS
jgi:hypothetical protein